MDALRSQYSLITAIGSPLTDDDELHVEGLEAQIHDQWANGITGLLVGGTMGAMQLLSDSAYRALVDHSIAFSRGHGEVLVGAGDASFARTRDRIRLLNKKDIDGVVVLSPFVLQFSQAELTDYFTALADLSTHPLYLYDLPRLTRTSIEQQTVETLARHPNIAGIKCSGDVSQTRKLQDLQLPNFRVIFAAADMIDVLMRAGVREHLDGIFAACPHWISGIADAAANQRWDQAALIQQKVNELLKLVREIAVFPTFTAIMNARGIPGRYAPRPYRMLDESVTEKVMSSPVVRELLASSSRPARAMA